ncbi:phospholipid-binding protein MlaC [Caulobacter sp. S45]|jgi:phospholipid transport system substrate-binding protein|uniref:MlaC/ttg2D family ABC transporter substrate-binding protein n=1 Tax=Caulobacter sp. S45 TaxID=1641861 RepID=UPI00131AF31C|nr:ABC transporter substrate-binding protein [Caulobacter sp. S45]
MPTPLSRRAAKLAGAAVLALTAALPLTLASSAPAMAQAARGHGDPQAEAYVQTQANRALTILNDQGMSVAAKKQAFYGFVNDVADVSRITDFVLGRYRRALTPEQYNRFAQAFRQYADSIYETRFGDYHGEKLTVSGSVARSPNDVVVSSIVSGADYKGNPVVNWRLLRGANGWKVVDIQAQGVWLAVVQQQDFTSTLANHNGDVDVLIHQLQSDASQGRPAH